MKKVSFIFIMTLVFSACSDKEKETELQTRIKELEVQLDDCENGAERVIAKVEKAYHENDFLLARDQIALLKERFPESPKNHEFSELLITMAQAEHVQDSLRIVEEKEKERLANLNNTGIWKVGHYVDEFGEPTKTGYIRNLIPIRGTFSNTATQDSELDVILLITNENDISIQLYEYAGNNPVKAYSSEGYTIIVQAHNGDRIQFNGWNRSDRISLDKAASKKLHNCLMKGGNVKFRIFEMRNHTTQYNFSIIHADYYDNAFRLLSEA